MGQEPLTPWGKALETLRLRQLPQGKKFSKAALARAAQMQINEYNRICFVSKVGPSIVKLDRILKAMGASWHDWAETYEKIQKIRRG